MTVRTATANEIKEALSLNGWNNEDYWAGPGWASLSPDNTGNKNAASALMESLRKEELTAALPIGDGAYSTIGVLDALSCGGVVSVLHD